MKYEEAKSYIHVRSAMYRQSKPDVLYYKNHTIPLDDRVPDDDKLANDWEEYDPREDPTSPRFNETPA